MDQLQSSTSSAIPASTSVDADATLGREIVRIGTRSTSIDAASTKLSVDIRHAQRERSRADINHCEDLDDADSVRPRQVSARFFKFNTPSYLQLYSRSTPTLSSRLFVVTAVCLAMAAGAPIPVIAVIFGKLIDSFPSTEDEVRSRLSQLLITAVVFLVLTYGWSASFGILGEQVASHHRKAVVEKLLRLDISSLQRLQQPRRASGEPLCDDLSEVGQTEDDTTRLDIDAMLTNRAHTIQVATSEKAGLMLQSLAYFVAAFVTAFTLNARVAGILFAAIVPAMIIIIVVTNRKTKRFGKQSGAYESAAHLRAEQSINGITTVQTLGIMDKTVQYYSTQLRQRQIWEVRKSIWTASMLGTIFFVSYAANSLAYYLAGQPTSGGEGNSAGTIFALVTLVIDASFVIAQIGPLMAFFTQGAEAGEELRAIIETPTTYIDPLSRRGDEVSRSMFDGPLELRSVCFAYDDNEKSLVLKDVNLTIQSKSMTGIVGSSGSGKSTITSLLLRLYDPTSGTLRLADADLTALNLASYRRLVAIVSQDNVLFPGTILENLCYGLDLVEKNALSQEEVLQRCQSAMDDSSCTDFVNKLPQGINTMITSSNELSSLSGGQKQRLALARALIRRPELLILDEFTSALDAKTEKAIMATLRNICARGKTTIVVIAHRLRTIREADNIIVMNHGRLMEQGTHEQLADHRGAYWRLLSSQTRRSQQPNHLPKTYDAKAKHEAVEVAARARAGQDEYGTTSSSDQDASISKAKVELDVPRPKKVNDNTSDVKKISLARAMLLCMRLARQHLFFLLPGLCAAVLCGLLVLAQSVILGNLIITLNQQNATTKSSDVSRWCLYLFLVAIAAFVGYTISGACLGTVSEKFTAIIQVKTLRHLLHQDMSWFMTQGSKESTTATIDEDGAENDENDDSFAISDTAKDPISSSSKIVTELRQDAGLMKTMSGPIFGVILSGMVSLFGGMILSLAISWRISVVIIPALPAMLAAGFLRIYILSLQEQRQIDGYASLASYVRMMLGDIKTVTTLGMEKEVLQRFNGMLDTEHRRGNWFVALSSLPFAMALSLTYFVYALAFWWGARQVREGNATSLQFFIVQPALLFSTQAAGQVFSFAPEMTRASAAARRVFSLLDEQPTILKRQLAGQRSEGSNIRTDVLRNSKDKEDNSHALELTQPAGIDALGTNSGLEVTFVNVNFRYPRQEHHLALSNICLSISSGCHIAFVGHSGSGKSTMLALFERLYDPINGEVMVNGRNVKQIDIDLFRSKLSYVAQEPLLFAGTITENILLGLPTSKMGSKQSVLTLCKTLGFDDFISSLPDGYETEVGSKGDCLSGGQRQRIAIARALIRDPSILLLDEATASLDPISEREIWVALDKWRQNGTSTGGEGHRNRTIVNVTHRLTTARHADTIVVFDQGEIREKGTHDELMAIHEGMYRELVQLQEVTV